MLDEFGIEEGESEKLVLIQVHHEELVGGRQVEFLGRELLVEVADVFAMFLLTHHHKSRKRPTIQSPINHRRRPSSRDSQSEWDGKERKEKFN